MTDREMPPLSIEGPSSGMFSRKPKRSPKLATDELYVRAAEQAEACTHVQHWSIIDRLLERCSELEFEVEGARERVEWAMEEVHMTVQQLEAITRAYDTQRAKLRLLEDDTPCTCEDLAHDTPVGELIEENRFLRVLLGLEPGNGEL